MSAGIVGMEGIRLCSMDASNSCRESGWLKIWTIDEEHFDNDIPWYYERQNCNCGIDLWHLDSLDILDTLDILDSHKF